MRLLEHVIDMMNEKHQIWSLTLREKHCLEAVREQEDIWDRKGQGERGLDQPNENRSQDLSRRAAGPLAC